MIKHIFNLGMKKVIKLQSLGKLDKEILLNLKKNLKWVFKGYIEKIEISPEILPLRETEYDKIRRQYNASKILKRLKDTLYEKEYFRILGITEEDLYAHYLNFVFGVARCPKDIFIRLPTACLISISRLRETFYRHPENKSLLELRILKEALHELGHTFGLSHCPNECVMQFSNRLLYTDKKPARFCADCLEDLETNFTLLIEKH